MKILHVPRTGGTAIKATLVKGYRRHPKNIKYLPTKIKGLYICNHRQRLDGRDKYIIFVRDPIDRFISHYIFLKYHAQGYDTENYMNPSVDKIIFKYNNINDFAKDIFRINLKKFIRFSDILISSKHIKKYKNNIFFVGRTEYLEIDFKKMQEKLNIKSQINLNKDYTNKRPGKYDEMIKLDNSTLRILRYYLDADYKIIKCLHELNFLSHNYLMRINYKI